MSAREGVVNMYDQKGETTDMGKGRAAHDNVHPPTPPTQGARPRPMGHGPG